MTVEQYIRFVLRFLKENKVYYAYLYNAKNGLIKKHKNGLYLEVDCNNYIETFSQRLHQSESMKYFFSNSFSWVETIEGYDFWKKISTKFFYEYQKETRVKRQN